MTLGNEVSAASGSSLSKEQWEPSFREHDIRDVSGLPVAGGHRCTTAGFPKAFEASSSCLQCFLLV